MATIPVQFLTDEPGPAIPYTPGSPSWYDLFAGPNALALWQTDTPGAQLLNAVFTYTTGGESSFNYGNSAADEAYLVAVEEYFSVLDNIALTNDPTNYAIAFDTFDAAYVTWQDAGAPYSGSAFNTIVAAVGVFNAAILVIVGNYGGSSAAYNSIIVPAFNTWNAAYETYLGWAAFYNTLVDAIAYNVANPTLPNIYSSVNVVR